MASKVARSRLRCRTGALTGLKASGQAVATDLQIHDWRTVGHLARRGDIGMAESYRDGWWHSADLENLVTLSLENERVIHDYFFGGKLTQIAAALSYRLRGNSLQGSRKNIQAHYDLGNDFYKLWLDPTMTYSAGIYGEDGDLTRAQLNKYDRIIDRLDSTSGSILEIGCGWGGFAERAVQRGDYAVRGITLSDAQHAYAAQRVGNNATIALQDYRHQGGTFDNIVSIEMFEAVGEKYWQAYFGKLSSLLKKGGRAMIQTITIDDARFESYRKGSDFIRSFIFPGGLLPGPARFKQEAEKAGFRLNDRFDFGRDYATTMENWLAAFDPQCACGSESWLR